MSRISAVILALVCVSSVALAGPNAGGTIFLHNAKLTYTNQPTCCGLGTLLEFCLDAVREIDNSGPDNLQVWKVYAGWVNCSSPRLKGMTFGVSYDDQYDDGNGVIIRGYGPCSQVELPMAGWPANNTGDSLVWDTAQTGRLTECYWLCARRSLGKGNSESESLA